MSLQQPESCQWTLIKQLTLQQQLIHLHLLITPQHHQHFSTPLAQLQLLFQLKLHQLPPEWAQLCLLGRMYIRLQQLRRQLHQPLFRQFLRYLQAQTLILITQLPQLKIVAILQMEYAMNAIIGFMLIKINVSQLIHFAKVTTLKEIALNAIKDIRTYRENVSMILISEDLPLHLYGHLLPLLVVLTQAPHPQVTRRVIHKVAQIMDKQIVIVKARLVVYVPNVIKVITIIKHHRNVL